jgi:hypothetical protein
MYDTSLLWEHERRGLWDILGYGIESRRSSLARERAEQIFQQAFFFITSGQKSFIIVKTQRRHIPLTLTYFRFLLTHVVLIFSV